MGNVDVMMVNNVLSSSWLNAQSLVAQAERSAISFEAIRPHECSVATDGPGFLDLLCRRGLAWCVTAWIATR